MEKSYFNRRKKTGILFLIMSLLFSYFLSKNTTLTNVFLIVALFFFVLTITNNSLLDLFYHVWITLGHLLGEMFRPIIFSLIYFFIIFPTYIYIKLFNKNSIQIKYKKTKTYWQDNHDKINMKEPF